MRLFVLALIAAVALATGAIVGYKLVLDEGTRMVQVERPDLGDTVEGLPREVWLTRSQLQLAAKSGDYEALRPLIRAQFEYTFGGPFEGGPIAYWQEVERTTGERPLAKLAAILKLPYVLSRGYYVWPWAYTLRSADDLSPHERGLLAPVGAPSELFPEGIGYLGWRAGIAPDGTWIFFVAGD